MMMQTTTHNQTTTPNAAPIHYPAPIQHQTTSAATTATMHYPANQQQQQQQQQHAAQLWQQHLAAYAANMNENANAFNAKYNTTTPPPQPHRQTESPPLSASQAGGASWFAPPPAAFASWFAPPAAAFMPQAAAMCSPNATASLMAHAMAAMQTNAAAWQQHFQQQQQQRTTTLPPQKSVETTAAAAEAPPPPPPPAAAAAGAAAPPPPPPPPPQVQQPKAAETAAAVPPPPPPPQPKQQQQHQQRRQQQPAAVQPPPPLPATQTSSDTNKLHNSNALVVPAFVSVHDLIHAAIVSCGGNASLRQIYAFSEQNGRIAYKRSEGSRLITTNNHWKSQIRHALYTSTGRFYRVNGGDCWAMCAGSATTAPVMTTVLASPPPPESPMQQMFPQHHDVTSIDNMHNEHGSNDVGGNVCGYSSGSGGNHGNTAGQSYARRAESRLGAPALAAIAPRKARSRRDAPADGAAASEGGWVTVYDELLGCRSVSVSDGGGTRRRRLADVADVAEAAAEALALQMTSEEEDSDLFDSSEEEKEVSPLKKRFKAATTEAPAPATDMTSPPSPCSATMASFRDKSRNRRKPQKPHAAA